MEIFSSELRFRSIRQNFERNSAEGNRRAIGLLRTSFWFTELMRRWGTHTPYALGKKLEPETYKKNLAGEAYSHNLWPKYARGDVIPSRKRLLSVNRADPGSLADYDHLLFDVVDPSMPVGSHADAWLQRLPRRVQGALYVREAGMRYRRRTCTARVLKTLEESASLDALAAIIVLLREAHDAGMADLAFEIGLSTYRSLLIVGTMRYGAIAPELSHAAMRLVFPLASSGHRKLWASDRLMDDQRTTLAYARNELGSRGFIQPDPKSEVAAAVQMMRGRFGRHIHAELLPRATSTTPTSDQVRWRQQAALYISDDDALRLRASSSK